MVAPSTDTEQGGESSNPNGVIPPSTLKSTTSTEVPVLNKNRLVAGSTDSLEYLVPQNGPRPIPLTQLSATTHIDMTGIEETDLGPTDGSNQENIRSAEAPTVHPEIIGGVKRTKKEKAALKKAAKEERKTAKTAAKLAKKAKKMEKEKSKLAGKIAAKGKMGEKKKAKRLTALYEKKFGRYDEKIGDVIPNKEETKSSKGKRKQKSKRKKKKTSSSSDSSSSKSSSSSDSDSSSSESS